MDHEITEGKADFIESQTKLMFDYAIESFDRAHAQGNNVLHWLFGVITGGMGIVSTLFTKEYYCLAVGAGAAVIAASYAAMKLLPALRSRETQAPGNLAANLNGMMDDTLPRMRWRAACGMDARITKNLDEGAEVWSAVNTARSRFTQLPAWLLGGTFLAYAAKFFFFSTP